MELKSFVHFKDGKVKNGTNDGMKLLGQFLLEQVGGHTNFFNEWLSEQQNETISASSFMLEKKGDGVILSHLNAGATAPFETTREIFTAIINRWKSLCNSDAHGVCKVGGYDVILKRDIDTNECIFDTQAG